MQHTTKPPEFPTICACEDGNGYKKATHYVEEQWPSVPGSTEIRRRGACKDCKPKKSGKLVRIKARG